MINLKYGVIISLLLCLSSGALALALALDFDAAAQLAGQNHSSATQAYITERMEHGNRIRLDERDNCYAKSPGQINQVVRINADGEIDLVLSDIDNEMSRCFKQTYLGQSFKPPPSAPLYLRMTMGRPIEQDVANIKNILKASCSRGVANLDRAKELKQSYCDCSMAAMEAELSDSEFIEITNMSSAGRHPSELPAMQKAMQRIQQCKSILTQP